MNVETIQTIIGFAVIAFYVWLLVIRKGGKYNLYKRLEKEGNRVTAEWYDSKYSSHETDSGRTEYYSQQYYEYFVDDKRYVKVLHQDEDRHYDHQSSIELYYDYRKPKKSFVIGAEKSMLKTKRALGCFFTFFLSAVTILAINILLGFLG